MIITRGIFPSVSKSIGRLLGTSSFVNASVGNDKVSTNKQFKELRINEIEEDANNRMINVQWTDGSSGRFPYVWLRDNCPAPHTYALTDFVRARKMFLKDLDLLVAPVRVDLDSSKTNIEIEWPNGKTGSYSADWLKARNLDDIQVRERRRELDLNWVELWDRKIITDKMTRVDFNSVMSDDETMLNTLTALMKYGIVTIFNAPGEGASADLGEHVGFTYPTHYMLNKNRAIDFVKSRPGHGNLSYTPSALGFHVDLPQCQYPPQTQMLHAIETASVGGENQFVDGFKVAEAMKVQTPELFHILTTTGFEFLDHGEAYIDYCLRAKWPMIRLNNAGDIEAIHFNNVIRTWFIDCPVTDIPRVYEALKTFNDFCYDPKHYIEVAMSPGEIVWFANDRVLHGRSSFELTPGQERHTETLYVNWDAVKSKIRVLRHKMKLDSYVTV